MAKSGTELGGIQAQAGRKRGRRRVFLLGVWRNED
jgi:hypothetical protein